MFRKTKDDRSKIDPEDVRESSGGLSRLISRIMGFSPRDHVWQVMDLWEEHRAFRRTVYGLLIASVLGGATWYWVHPWWSKRNAISVARQWLATDRLDRATEAVQQAIYLAPDNPDTWQLAGELAFRKGNRAIGVHYAEQGARVAKNEIAHVLKWASLAVQADMLEDAQRAMSGLTDAQIASSSHALRIAGEIERQRRRLSAACARFEAALALDGPSAINEVPLGSVLLFSTDPVQRARGLTLLSRWTADPSWGATSLRILLQDALRTKQQTHMREWAMALRSHPQCTLGDIPNCLSALSISDPKAFSEVMSELKKQYAAEPEKVMSLMTWMIGAGHADEAADWMLSLPSTITRSPFVVVIAAEALRISSRWTELGAWTGPQEWAGDTNFLRYAYGFEAARKLGDTTKAAEFWKTLRIHADKNGAHALFAADVLYTWGLQTESLTLMEIAADSPSTGIQALGTLVRHYQMQRDAQGQFDAFRRLYSLRTDDPAIANNYVFFAALMGREYSALEKIAKKNFEADNSNLNYRATYAFVLSLRLRTADAMEILNPVLSQWKTSPGIAFAYGVTLAKAGSRDEARKVFATLNPNSLTIQETELIASLLK